MLLSCALFAGATHAWFTDRCSAQITLQSATFDVGVVVAPEEGTPSISPDANGVCELSTGTYTVTLTRVGEGTVGYCKISVGDDVYYSPNLPAQTDSFSYTLVINGDNVPVTFTPKWSNAEQAGLTPIDSNRTISYTAGTAATPTNEAESETTVLSESPASGSTAAPEPSEPEQPETNNSNEETSGTGEESTESSNSSGTESEVETGAGGTSEESTAEASESANG